MSVDEHAANTIRTSNVDRVANDTGDTHALSRLLHQAFVQGMIRVGLIALVAFACIQIFSPFAALMLWALILSVTLYPVHQRLANQMSGNQRRASTLMVLTGLILIGVPMVLLGVSFTEHAHTAFLAFKSDAIVIPAPKPEVADWPIVGKQVFEFWQSAADNLASTMTAMRPQLIDAARWVLGAAAGTMGTVMLFLGALIIAGVMMAYGASGAAASQRICRTLGGHTRGDSVYQLATATIRSVASGVIGVAFIQAILLGIGFLFAGVPGAGILAIVTLLIGIVQLPVLILTLPVIGYLWGVADGSSFHNVAWSVYLILAGFSDGVLKPILLGRGVDAPMPVILIGALGGMVSLGLLGLFIGAVVLAVGYRLFMSWVDHENEGSVAQAEAEVQTNAANIVPAEVTDQ